MTTPVRCAIYTRKSSEEGLEQSFNSLHAQREACEAYIMSQRHEGWQLIHTKYDDGGFSGGTMERPALRHLLGDIAAKRVDTVIVYKVDRLTRSLTDFAKIVEQFDQQGISFVSVTQQFNTTTSMGRLTLNVLLSFAQFEREVTGERIRDKIAASKRKGMWMGGVVPLGYDLQDRRLILNAPEADLVREIYHLYLKLGCVSKLQVELEQRGIRSKKRVSRNGRASGGAVYSRGALYDILHNRIYLGEITHKGKSYPGQQPALIDQELWDQVQARVAANLQAPRRRPRATEKSILTGLLFDRDGNRFVPSHATKKGKRYRYYNSQAVTHGSDKGSTAPARLPAQEIEDLVSSQITELLGSPQRLLDLLTDSSAKPSELQQLLEALERTVKQPDHENRVLQSAVTRVVVADELVEIHLSKDSLREAVLGQETEPHGPGSEGDSTEVMILQAPARLKRCGGEVRFVLPPDSGHAKSHHVPSLIRAVARAHHWVGLILRGDATTQRSIAAETGLDARYVSRILPLAFLAPDLTEAILEGTHSPDLALGSCLENLSADWVEQRSSFAGQWRRP